jgi:dTMP kinase
MTSFSPASPGGTPESEKIRDLLVQRDGGHWTPMAECLLFFAARQMHVEKLIKPSLAAGKIVICDRFTDSTIAYQGYGHGFDIPTIEQIAHLSFGDFQPDLTFILDLPVAEGLARSLRQKEGRGGAGKYRRPF